MLRCSMFSLLLFAACSSSPERGTTEEPVNQDTATAPDATSPADTASAETGPTEDDAPAPPPPAKRVDIVDLGDFAHADGVGMTAAMSVDLPEDAVSFQITAMGTPGVYYAVDALKAPNGKAIVLPGWYDSALNGDQAEICIVCLERVASSETVHSVLVPNSPDVPMMPGTWTFSLYAFTREMKGGFFGQPTYKPAGGQVHVEVAIKRSDAGPPTAGVLDLNLHFTGAGGMSADSAAADPNVQKILDAFAGIYAAIGISLGTVTYRDVDPGLQVVDGFNGKGNDFEAVAATAAGAPPGVNVFFVRELTDSASPMAAFGVILGISGGVPGPAALEANGRSAVLISTADVPGQPKGDATHMGVTMAHEVGHYLGLFHSSEFGFGQNQVHDPLPDTGENDTGNLMYYESSGNGKTLSNDQGAVLRANPWVHEPTKETAP